MKNPNTTRLTSTVFRVCLGYLLPLPTLSQVLWFRNSFSIQPTDRHLMTARNGRHMLHIKNLQTEDFGNYR